MTGFTPMRLVCRDCREQYWEGRALNIIDHQSVALAHAWTHDCFQLCFDGTTFHVHYFGEESHD